MIACKYTFVSLENPRVLTQVISKLSFKSNMREAIDSESLVLHFCFTVLNAKIAGEAI